MHNSITYSSNYCDNITPQLRERYKIVSKTPKVINAEITHSGAPRITTILAVAADILQKERDHCLGFEVRIQVPYLLNTKELNLHRWMSALNIHLESICSMLRVDTTYLSECRSAGNSRIALKTRFINLDEI